MPHLKRVSHWALDGMTLGNGQTLITIRELRRNFIEPGDLEWHAQAAEALESIRADAPGLAAWLANRPTCDYLKKVS